MSIQKKHLTIALEIYAQEHELPAQVAALMQEAKKARANAYAPYSKFKVGAAIQLSNGEVVTGNNQENAAYPSGMCAERTAIYAAGARFPDAQIEAIAICVKAHNQVISQPASPCGACRQAMAEYEQKQKTPIPVYFMGETGPVYKVDAVLDLLPLAFDSSFL